MADQVRILPADDDAPRMPVPDGVPLPQRYWAILTIALGLTLAVLDGSSRSQPSRATCTPRPRHRSGW